MKGNSSNIKIGVALTYITQFAGILISLFYIPVMLRMLGQEEYGLYALVQSIVAYIQMSEMGIGVTATRYNANYIAKGNSQEQMSANGLFNILYIGIALLCVILGLVVYLYIPTWYSHYSANNIELTQQLFILALANLAITLIFKIYNSIIIAYERFIFLKVLQLIVTVLGPISMIIVLLMGERSIGMLYVTTVFSFLSGLFQMLYCKLKLKIKFQYHNFPKGLFLSIYSFTAFVFLNSIAHQLFSNSDKIIISLMLNEVSIAIFAVVVQFQVYFYNFANVISGFFLPRFTKSVALTGVVSVELMSEIVRTGRLQTIVAAVIFGGFISIGKPFIVLWVGSDYEPAYLLTIFVLFAEFLGSPQSMFNSLMQALNLHKTRAIISISISVIKIGVIFWMVNVWGIIGCAIGYLIVYALRMAVYNIYYQKIGINIKYFWAQLWWPFLKILIILFTIFIFLFHLMKILIINTYGDILIYSIVYISLFFTGCWLFVMSSYEKDLFKKGIRKLWIKKI
jgi:O-antigen/teichoic acid export membrane protein